MRSLFKRSYLFHLLLVTQFFFWIFHPVSHAWYSSEETASVASDQSNENESTGDFVDEPIQGENSAENQNYPGSDAASTQESSESNGEFSDLENAENSFEDCDVPFEEFQNIDFCDLVKDDESAAYFGLKCDSPSNSASSSHEDLHDPQGTKWPNGIVKYKLDNSLTKKDIDQFYESVKEYHSKTCIQFLPVNENEIGPDDEGADFTTIWVNPAVCGRGTVCKVSSNNYASFGKHCRKSTTMIHELGHNLCLYHEHSRSDRDDYLGIHPHINERSKKRKKEISGEDKNYAKKPEHYSHPMFYDYASTMHYGCGKGDYKQPISSIRKCGKDQQPGLSVLDADSINELYSCGGCHSHRWITPERVSNLMTNNLADFGFRSSDKSAIYPCRAAVGEIGKEIAVGMYNVKTKTCYLAKENRVVKVTKTFQVLYIPKNKGNSGYTLVPSQHGDSDGVAGGHQLDPYKRQFIAYVMETNGVGSIGKIVSNVQNEPLGKSEVVVRNKVKSTKQFYILKCFSSHVTAKTPFYPVLTTRLNTRKPLHVSAKTPMKIFSTKPTWKWKDYSGYSRPRNVVYGSERYNNFNTGYNGYYGNGYNDMGYIGFHDVGHDNIGYNGFNSFGYNSFNNDDDIDIGYGNPEFNEQESFETGELTENAYNEEEVSSEWNESQGNDRSGSMEESERNGESHQITPEVGSDNSLEHKWNMLTSISRESDAEEDSGDNITGEYEYT